ncbi:MAG: DinB family protein [Phycisphaerales bacterium]
MPTLSINANRILIASDAWGTRILLEQSRPLTREQFHRRFEMGLGSIHDTFTHIISVTRRWTDRLADRPTRPMLLALAEHPHIPGESRERTIDELLELTNDAERDLYAVVREDPAWLASTVTTEWPGEDGTVKCYTFSRAAVIVHLTTHGYHHRAQILNMLRHLNVPGVSDSLPEPSAADWQSEIESPPVIRAAATP